MADLAIKIGDNSTYKDKDIIQVFTGRRIRCVHAQHLCHVKLAGGGVGVLRDNNHIARDWFEATAQYRFERVSHTEMKRIILATMEEVILDGTPRTVNGKISSIDVPLYMKRRLSHPRHRIFGAPGREIWYGGRTNMSNVALDKVWTAIEAKTPNREIDFTQWPIGQEEARIHLFYPVEDMTDARAEEVVTPLTRDTGKVDDDGEPIIETVAKRKYKIDWRSLPGIQEADVLDRTKRVMMRDIVGPVTETTVVQAKTLATI